MRSNRKVEFLITCIMESVLSVASYIYHRYERAFHEHISEMKLHKLLYFVQRESLIQLGEPMFADDFQAWRYGPVMPNVRYVDFDEVDELSKETVLHYQSVFDYVFEHYAPLHPYVLSDITHTQLSWLNARKGLDWCSASQNPMSLDDIRLDADRAKLRRITHFSA